MNARIKELAEQAFVITTDGKIGHVNTHIVEKFAELIVRECADVAATVVADAEGVEFGLVAACYQHFGIEQ